MTPHARKAPLLDPEIADRRGNWIRLRTLLAVRWFAIAGQAAALAVAELWLHLDLALGPCLLLVTLSAAVNLVLGQVFPANLRMSARQMLAMLLFDVVQLSLLVALTGGLNNPFAFLVLAPVAISASTLPLRRTLLVAGLAVLLITLSAFAHLPIRLPAGAELSLPPLLRLGFWIGIVLGIVFMSFYAWRVALEIHAMSEALLATQLTLSREQKLTDLGGVVAAAAHQLGTPLATIKLASAEMLAELADRPGLAEDARLIRDQADRCRDILRAMGQAGQEDSFPARIPFRGIVREAAEPHLARGKAVSFVLPDSIPAEREPMIERRPEIVHGLRNLIQNAVDFAAHSVRVETAWAGRALTVSIADDGPGFPPALMGRLGDPFLPGRDRPDAARPGYAGMGLGLFIAKTLLERTGAELEFLNDGPLGGALVRVVWPDGAVPGGAVPGGDAILPAEERISRRTT